MAPAPPPPARALPGGAPARRPDRAPIRPPAAGTRALRAPYWPVATGFTALLAVSALFPQPILRDPELPARAASGVALARPALYTTLAPITTSFDELTLLSVRQHIALMVGALIVYGVWRVVRRRTAVGAGRDQPAVISSAIRELAGVVACLGAIFGVQFVSCLAPRPMASLAVSDPDLVRVDFHAHTQWSHDGRRSFDVERSRRWHRDGGFDVAYVSDHGTFAAAAAGVRANPARAGDGTVVLSAVEAWSGGEHLNVLGATATDVGFLREDEQLDEAVIGRALAAGRRQPVFIETVPGFLDTLVIGLAGGFPHRAMHRVNALEISDAAPRGFEETDSTRERAFRVADSLDLALVAGSDNHGWGRTAAAWSLVPVPGWRALSPEALGLHIERRILEHRRAAVRVVERGRPRTIRGPAVLLNAPIVLWHLFTTLPPAERVSWLAWTWALALAWRSSAGRRRGRQPALHIV